MPCLSERALSVSLIVHSLACGAAVSTSTCSAILTPRRGCINKNHGAWQVIEAVCSRRTEAECAAFRRFRREHGRPISDAPRSHPLIISRVTEARATSRERESSASSVPSVDSENVPPNKSLTILSCAADRHSSRFHSGKSC